MKPLHHFLISFVSALCLSLWFRLGLNEATMWIFLGSAFGTFMDSDHFFYGLLVNKDTMVKYLRSFSFAKIYYEIRDPNGGMHANTPKRLAVYWLMHTMSLSAIVIATSFTLNAYTLPISVATFIHYISDFFAVVLPKVIRS